MGQRRQVQSHGWESEDQDIRPARVALRSGADCFLSPTFSIVTWLAEAMLSPRPVVSIVSVAFARALFALTQRSHCHTYWFILANLNSVAGDEVRFSGCVNHQQKPIEGPEEQNWHLGGA